MADKLTPDAYRQLAEKFRAISIDATDATKAAAALREAKSYERKARTAEAELRANLTQLKKPS